ncbi:MAG: hypothetical protein ACYC64_08500 [Armatimonadota bacterium]
MFKLRKEKIMKITISNRFLAIAAMMLVLITAAVPASIAAGTILSTSIVDPLMDDSYWYASENVTIYPEGQTQDPWYADNLVVGRDNGDACWFSYRVVDGKQIAGVTYTQCHYFADGVQSVLQVQNASGNWQTVAYDSRETDMVGVWWWYKDTYTQLPSGTQAVRISRAAGVQWNNHPSNVELTVNDVPGPTLLTSSLVDPLMDSSYWYESQNVTIYPEGGTQDPWYADNLVVGRDNGDPCWFSYRAVDGKQITGCIFTQCHYFADGVQSVLQVQNALGDWQTVAYDSRETDMVGVWWWYKNTYLLLPQGTQAVRIFRAAGVSWNNHPSNVELTVGDAPAPLLTGSIVDTFQDARYINSYANVWFTEYGRDLPDPWYSDVYMIQRLYENAGMITYKAADGLKINGALLTKAAFTDEPHYTDGVVQVKLADGTWQTQGASITESATSGGWPYTKKTYTHFSANELRIYIAANDPNDAFNDYWNPILGGLELTVGGIPSVSVRDAKEYSVGSELTITGSITAVFDGVIYIESSDRVSGIRVDKASHGLVAADVDKLVTITGTVAKDATTDELYINAGSIALAGQTVEIKPLGLTNKAAGGGNSMNATGNGQVGVADGFGLNNIGLLVRTTGLASAGDANGFTLTDGSGVTMQVSLAGAGTTYDGRYVTVTGISSIGSGGVRVIKARAAGDAQPVN